MQKLCDLYPEHKKCTWISPWSHIAAFFLHSAKIKN